jgi:hypothetical protein
VDESQQVARGHRPVQVDVAEHEQLREHAHAALEGQAEALPYDAVRTVAPDDVASPHRLGSAVRAQQAGGHPVAVLGELPQLDTPLDPHAMPGEAVRENAFGLVLRQAHVGVRQAGEVPVDLVRLATVDVHGLAVQQDARVHRLARDADVLPELHGAALDADGLVGGAGGVGPLVDDPAGDAAPGQLDRRGQARRTRPHDQDVGRVIHSRHSDLLGGRCRDLRDVFRGLLLGSRRRHRRQLVLRARHDVVGGSAEALQQVRQEGRGLLHVRLVVRPGAERRLVLPLGEEVVGPGAGFA